MASRVGVVYAGREDAMRIAHRVVRERSQDACQVKSRMCREM